MYSEPHLSEIVDIFTRLLYINALKMAVLNDFLLLVRGIEAIHRLSHSVHVHALILLHVVVKVLPHKAWITRANFR